MENIFKTWVSDLFHPKGRRLSRLPFAFYFTGIFAVWMGIVAMLYFVMPVYPAPFFRMLYFVMLYFILLVSIKRLRDLNRSGWFCLLYFVPVMNIIFIFYLCFKKSAVEGDRFYANPV